MFLANVDGTLVGSSGIARGDITVSGLRVTELLKSFIFWNDFVLLEYRDSHTYTSLSSNL